MNCEMLIHKLLFLFFCFVFILSTVTAEEAAGSNDSQDNARISSNSSTKYSSHPELGSERNVSQHIMPPVSLEGGATAPVLPANRSTTAKTTKEEESSARPNLSATDLYNSLETGSSTNPKHLSIARKGVNVNDTFPNDSEPEHTSSGSVSAGKVDQTLLKDANNDTSTQTSTTIVIKSPFHESRSTVSSVEVTINTEMHSVTRNNNSKGDEIKEDQQNVTLMIATTLPTPRLKPEFTMVDSNSDDQSSFSFSSEGDYVIPVVAIIFAAPLLIILGMVLYKRSKEFWERRHYRRMDFLIDGMYND